MNSIDSPEYAGSEISQVAQEEEEYDTRKGMIALIAVVGTCFLIFSRRVTGVR